MENETGNLFANNGTFSLYEAQRKMVRTTLWPDLAGSKQTARSQFSPHARKARNLVPSYVKRAGCN